MFHRLLTWLRPRKPDPVAGIARALRELAESGNVLTKPSAEEIADRTARRISGAMDGYSGRSR